jgi:polysaccharide deacetylase 2 family uncharacterized protein YibQ
MIDLSRGLDVLRVISRHTMDAPIHGKDVETLTSVDDRTIAEVVSTAVARGVPVASSSNGYFFWRSKEERETYFAREKSRLQSIARKVSQAKKASFNTITLFEQEGI